MSSSHVEGRRKATDAVSEDGWAGEGTHDTSTIYMMYMSGFRRHSGESVFIVILHGRQGTLDDIGDFLELIINRTPWPGSAEPSQSTLSRAWSPLSCSRDSW